MKTSIYWFRNDLRVLDNPALIDAIKNSDNIIPLFILDSKILKAKNASSNRNRFLLESLEDLDDSLIKIGGKLILRNGDPSEILENISNEFNAQDIYYSDDYTPFSIKRDNRLDEYLKNKNIETHRLEEMF